MNKITIFNRVRWIAKISFIILFIIEKFYYFEGLTTAVSNQIKYFKISFLIVFIIASIVENKLIIKEKD